MTVHRLLLGALVVQCLLAAFVWIPRGPDVVPTPLVPFGADAIERITIESVSTRARGGDLVLARDGDGWVIDSAHRFPARSGQVEALIERTLGLRLGRPITEDPALHDKLNVGLTNATRHITIDAGEEQVRFLAGTATRDRLNLRLPGQDAVYQAGGMGAWRFDDSLRGYLPERALEVPVDQVQQLTVRNPSGVLTVERGPEGWTVDGTPADTGAVEGFLQRALTLRVSAPVAVLPTVDAPELQVAWTRTDGSTGAYDGRVDEGALHITLADGSLPPFSVGKGEPGPTLLQATPAALFRAPAPDPSAESPSMPLLPPEMP